ncbi:glycosyltransferase [Mycolicibacterium sp.]|uniref:glycosyltransferase n=1 Tax=Mycolicibacterium sp. TaxID=2320850 RepID=UPI0037C704CC
MSAVDHGGTTPLTVAHVIHSLGAGGAEAVLVELARAAPSAGIRLVVVGLSDAVSDEGIDNRVVPLLREQGAVVHELHSGRYDATAIARLAKVLREEHVDIVHTHLKHADLVGGLAARRVGVPSVSTLHVIDIPTSRMHRLRVKVAVVGRRFLSSVVIALSSAQRAWYAQYAGVDAPIVVLPNGIAEPQVSRDRDQVRAGIGVPRDSVLALCASLMRPEKGHADLLEAVRLLPADIPMIVAMAGDGPLFEEISAAVRDDPALAQRIRLLGFRSDIADLIAASDFVIQPSLEDALPTSLISALAGGRPIVATQVGGIPDIVGPGCGLLVQPGQPMALSAGIAEMATTVTSDAPALAAIGRAARERYETLFSADVWASKLRALYETVIGGNNIRRRIVLVEFPPSGGLYQFALQLGEAVARAGTSVELVTGPAPELDSREPDCRVRSILPTWHPTAGADAPAWWRKARRVVRAGQHSAAWVVLLAYLLRARPDVVVWSAWRFPIDGWGVRAARRMLPKTVLALVAHEPRPLVEQPGQEGMYKTSSTTVRALAPAYADLDTVFVLGESAKDVLIETWPIAAPVHVIPHGDEGIFAQSPVPGAETTGPVALSFGTITAYKGIDTLCLAWPSVRARVPDAQLVIAGSLSADIDEAALRAQVAALPGVSLQTGYVPVADVAGYFARARCVVLPYKRSSQSGVAHLAFTMGRPVVATRVGDIPAVVRDEVSGLLVPPDDPDALAEAMIRVLTDAELAASMGKAGAESLAESATWDEVADRFLRALPAARRPSAS